MLFTVSRSSDLCGDRPLRCEEAFKRPVKFEEMSMDYTAEAYDKRNAYCGRTWFSEGSNHRVHESGRIVRDIVRYENYVEFESFEDLERFCDKYGEVVVYRSDRDPHVLHIEIYDDYRE